MILWAILAQCERLLVSQENMSLLPPVGQDMRKGENHRIFGLKVTLNIPQADCPHLMDMEAEAGVTLLRVTKLGQEPMYSNSLY